MSNFEQLSQNELADILSKKKSRYQKVCASLSFWIVRLFENQQELSSIIQSKNGGK